MEVSPNLSLVPSTSDTRRAEVEGSTQGGMQAKARKEMKRRLFDLMNGKGERGGMTSTEGLCT